MSTIYKNYLLRQMGVKESQIKPSIVERNAFPNIDPDELEMGSKDEKEEHGMSDEKAAQTAAQHLQQKDQGHYYTGMEKAKKQGMLKDALMGGGMLSPTAKATPVIAVAIRGSNTGGLPSGADQTGISPSTPTGRLGGYEPIPTAKDNSELIDKTPSNPQINSPSPKAEVPQTIVDPHPHQTQHATGDVPQAVTGASTDSDSTLTLKSLLSKPKTVDIDVAEEGGQKMNDMDGEESMEDNDKAQQGLNEGKHKSGCQCGFCKNKGSFGKKKDTDEGCCDEKKEEVDEGKKKKETHPKGCCVKCWEKGRQITCREDGTCPKCSPKATKVDETFKRHTMLMKEYLGIKESKCKCGDPDCTCDCVTDECKTCGCGKLNTVHEEVTPAKLVRVSEAFEKMRGLANLGERRVMSDGLWNSPINEEKWMQDASKPSTKGALHKDLGIPEDKKIPTEKLESLKKMLHTKAENGELTPKELKLSRRVNAALNMRQANETLNETFKRHKKLMNESIQSDQQ